MRGSLNQLIQIMPPPARPFASTGDWTAIAAKLGTSLPADYMAFIEYYGTGRISQFLFAYNPFEPNRYLNLLSCHSELAAAERFSRRDYPEQFHDTFFPEPNGLLLWGCTDNGDQFFWRPSGDPDSWTVIAREARGPEGVSYSYPNSMTGFLLGWLRGDFAIEIFPPANWEPIFEQNPNYGA